MRRMLQSVLPTYRPQLKKETSTTPDVGSKPHLSEGKFTLSRAHTFRQIMENDVIFESLRDCLLNEGFPRNRILMIDNIGSDSRDNYDDMIDKVEASPNICGEGMEKEFINESVSAIYNGVLLWEKGKAIVGVITYNYREYERDVYIDGLCMNKLKQYSGGYQLLSFFINCLTESGFNLFSLMSVPDSIMFYERNGFSKNGRIVDGLQPMSLRVGERGSDESSLYQTPTPPSPSPKHPSPRMRGDNAGAIMSYYKKTPIVKLKHKRRTHKRRTHKRTN
jgi:hypothetical protein